MPKTHARIVYIASPEESTHSRIPCSHSSDDVSAALHSRNASLPCSHPPVPGLRSDRLNSWCCLVDSSESHVRTSRRFSSASTCQRSFGRRGEGGGRWIDWKMSATVRSMR